MSHFYIGRGTSLQMVSLYTLSYSIDGLDWTDVTNETGVIEFQVITPFKIVITLNSDKGLKSQIPFVFAL